MELKFRAIDGQVIAADPISGVYLLRTGKGKDFTVCGSGPRLFLREGHRQIGSIMRSSLGSGSVWLNGTCIGEYSFVNEEYEVIPIREGLLELTCTERIHPINFLIKRS